jgi:VCBS repeat-containing protein
MNVTGQAWIRNPDGSLSMLQAGSRIPPGAEMFTAPGASVAVRMEGGMPVLIGPDTQAVTDAPDAGRHEAPPSTAVAVPVEAEWPDRTPTVDVQSGSTQEDQAARAMASGDNDGGNSFVRVDRIVEMAGDPPLLGSLRVAPPAVDGALESRSAAPTAPRAGKTQAGKPLDATDPAAEKITVAHHAEAERGPREIRSMREAPPAENPENHIPLLTDATVELTEDQDVDASTGLLTATGQLAIVDQDAGQDSFQPHARFDGSTGNGNSPLGSLVFNTDGSYTYTVDNARPELQGLKAGERIVETYTVTSLDGSATSTITIVIHGTNDLPQLSSGTAELTEDRNVDASTGRLTTQGQLAIVDADAGQSRVQPHARFEGSTGNGNEPLGALVLHGDASYAYSVDNAHPAIQALDAGERIVETYTATSLDGTTSSTITIVIQGARDTPRLSSGTSELTEDRDVDAATGLLTATGQLSITDQDAGQSRFQPEARFDGATGHANAPLGTLVFNTDGSYTYTVDNGRPELQALKAGERIVETYTVTSLDGSATSTITIVIHGTNDVPQLSSATSEITEDLDVDVATGMIGIKGQLTIADQDAGQDSFQPQARFDGSTANGNAPLGSLVFSADGSYTYTVNNASPELQALKAGERIVETYTVTSLDGSATSTITIVIHGTDDVPQLSSGKSEITEDLDVDEATGSITAKGQLIIADQDAGQESFQPHARFDGSTGNGNTPLGTLVFNTDGSYTYTVDNTKPELQALKAGERIVETYTVTSLDGSATSTIAIAINGANDPADITVRYMRHPFGRGGANDHGVVVEDETISTSGTLQVRDVDAGEDRFIVQGKVAGLYGSFSIAENGSWHYLLNNDDPAVQALGAGHTMVEHFTVSSLDGTALHTVTVTIKGSNDIPEIASGASAVTEDHDVVDGQLTARGQVRIADRDEGEGLFQAGARFDGSTGNGNAPLGTLVFNPDGSYIYTVDNARPELQALKAGESIIETYTVTSLDGTKTGSITITLHGTDDGATITPHNPGDPQNPGSASDHGQVTEDLQDTTGGRLDIHDADAGQSRFVAQALHAGNHGGFSIDESGNWTYKLENNDPAVQALGAGQTLTEKFTVSSADGSAQHAVTVTIVGTNDVPVLSSGTVDLTEDFNVDEATGLLGAKGRLTIADHDAGQSAFQPEARFDGSTGNDNLPLGTLVFSADGSYTYSVENGHPSLQALKAGERIVETYTVTSLDGTATSTITVAINGTDDGATITPHRPDSDTGQVVEDVTYTTGGKLDVQDPDPGQSQFVAQPGTPGQHGTFTIDANGNWTYNLTNSDPLVQQLGKGETLVEKFTVSSVDGSAQHGVTVTIVGTNDIPTISGVSTGATTEDGASEVTGQLGVADVDIRDGHTWTVDGHPKGSHGYLAVDATGKWTYTVDTQATQALAAAQEAHDVFMIKTDDGHGGTATQTITVKITGTNDIPVITPHTSGSDRGLVIEDAQLSAQGKLDITDADQGQSTFKPQTVQDAYGTFTVDGNGNWTYTLDNNNPAVQALSGNDTLGPRTFTVTSQDGTTTHTVTVNIGGTNDAPTSADNAASVGLGQPHTFGIDEFAFSDSHGEHDSLQSVVITRTPESGSLTLDGQAVTQGGVISVANIAAGKLVYSPGIDGKGTSFGFAVRDTGGTANAGHDTSGEYNFDVATHELVVGGNESSGDGGLPPLMGGAGDDVIVGDKGGVRTTTTPGKSYNIAFIVDVSDSMRHGLNNTSTPEPGQEKISLATAALTELLKELAKHPGDINVTVIAFDHEARTIASVSGLNTVNVEEIVAKIREMPATGGGTNCESGINMATAWFREQPTVDSAGNKRENIASLLSDGMPNRTNSLTDIDSGVQTLTQTLRAAEALKEVSLFRPIAVGVPPSAEPFFRMLSGMPGDEVVKARAFRQTQISDPFEIKASYSPYGDESRPTVLHTAPVRLDMGSTLSFTVQSQPGSQDPYRWVLQRETQNGWEELYPEDGAYSRRDELTAQTRAVNEPGNYRLMFELHDQTPDDRDATITISALSRIDPTEITGPAGNILNVHNAADLQAGLNRGLIISQRETPGDDTLFGTDGADVIFGDTPNTDALSWPGHPAGTHDGQGMDALADYLAAMKGHSPTAEELYDYIKQHADTLNARDDAHGGNDTIRGGKGDDFIHGQGGNDHLRGEAGRNFLHGGAGNDTLIAGDEGDVLIGGRDNDLMLGGQGSDSFRWEQGDHGTREAPAVDTIRNFSADAVARGGDVLDLRDLLGDPDEGDLTRYLHFTRDGNGTAIQVNTAGAGPGNGFDQKIMLENVDLTNNGMLQDAAIIKELMLKGTLLGEGQV